MLTHDEIEVADGMCSRATNLSRGPWAVGPGAPLPQPMLVHHLCQSAFSSPKPPLASVAGSPVHCRFWGEALEGSPGFVRRRRSFAELLHLE